MHIVHILSSSLEVCVLDMYLYICNNLFFYFGGGCQETSINFTNFPYVVICGVGGSVM